MLKQQKMSIGDYKEQKKLQAYQKSSLFSLTLIRM
jgi:foldase protein PrsA